MSHSGRAHSNCPLILLAAVGVVVCLFAQPALAGVARKFVPGTMKLGDDLPPIYARELTDVIQRRLNTELASSTTIKAAACEYHVFFG